jgi:hypothetical protein
MRYTAPRIDSAAWRDSETVVLPVTRAADSAFAPSAALLADVTAGRAGWRQFERRSTAELRASYRADPQLWIDLVEHAAIEVDDVVLACDECGPQRPEAGEAFARCHRRLLKALVLAVATDRGLMVDPDLWTPSTGRCWRSAAGRCSPRGSPARLPGLHPAAGTARAFRGRDGYGYGSEACLEADVARPGLPTRPHSLSMVSEAAVAREAAIRWPLSVRLNGAPPARRSDLGAVSLWRQIRPVLPGAASRAGRRRGYPGRARGGGPRRAVARTASSRSRSKGLASR